MTKAEHISAKISAEALAAHEDDFHRAMEPMEMAWKVDQLGRVLGDHRGDATKAKFWREAYYVSAFALHRKARSIRLLQPERSADGLLPPDCEMIDHYGRAARYELVEAIKPRRMRDAEYREDREHGVQARESFFPTSDEVRAILDRLSRKKADKALQYERVTGLIIALDLESSAQDDQTRRDWLEGTKAAAQAFEEVWVLRLGMSWLVWLRGEPFMR